VPCGACRIGAPHGHVTRRAQAERGHHGIATGDRVREERRIIERAAADDDARGRGQRRRRARHSDQLVPARERLGHEEGATRTGRTEDRQLQLRGHPRSFYRRKNRSAAGSRRLYVDDITRP
jgi:hypothetical protein